MVILFNALFYAHRSPPLRNGYRFPGRWKAAKKRQLFSPASDPMVSNPLPTADKHFAPHRTRKNPPSPPPTGVGFGL